jgi:hypothetical protein
MSGATSSTVDDSPAEKKGVEKYHVLFIYVDYFTGFCANFKVLTVFKFKVTTYFD